MAGSNRTTRYLLSFLMLCFFGKHAMPQKLREIIIIKDTLFELNKHIGIIEDSYIEDGLKIYTVDSLNKIISIATYKENQLNGEYYAFYVDANMLEHKGTYRN